MVGKSEHGPDPRPSNHTRPARLWPDWMPFRHPASSAVRTTDRPLRREVHPESPGLNLRPDTMTRSSRIRPIRSCRFTIQLRPSEFAPSDAESITRNPVSLNPFCSPEDFNQPTVNSPRISKWSTPVPSRPRPQRDRVTPSAGHGEGPNPPHHMSWSPGATPPPTRTPHRASPGDHTRPSDTGTIRTVHCWNDSAIRSTNGFNAHTTSMRASNI